MNLIAILLWIGIIICCVGEVMITIKMIKGGISQEKFALKIEMDRTYYASVEAGKRNISILNIEKIANGLNISLSDLFSAVENNKGDK